MGRLSRECVLTEKIDGTNGQLLIVERPPIGTPIGGYVAATENVLIYAGSRNRWLQLGDDNYGFAKWVAEHAEELHSCQSAGTSASGGVVVCNAATACRRARSG